MQRKALWVAAFLVIILVAIATTWFLLNQGNNLNQTSMVRITAFSIDPDGWVNPGGLLITCSFNVTLQNMGAKDVEGLKLRVKMFVNGIAVDVKNDILGVENDLVNDVLLADEVLEFRGELQYSLHHEGAIDSIGVHPAGSFYVAQVMLGEDILDEAEWKPS